MDSGADLDWSRAERVRPPNLQPSTTAISLRRPMSLLEQIKIAAHKRDVPYQALIKMWLAQKGSYLARRLRHEAQVKTRPRGCETLLMNASDQRAEPTLALHVLWRPITPRNVRIILAPSSGL